MKIEQFISKLSSEILNPLILLLFALAMLYFVYGLIRFIAQGGDEDVRSTAKRHILYGLFGMFIMFSAFALIRLVTGTLGIDTSKNLDTIEK